MDMSMIELSVPDKNVVELRGMIGKPRPAMLRALIGVHHGYKAIGEASLGGAGCLDRAKLAADIIRERLTSYKDDIIDMKFEIFGISTMYGNLSNAPNDLNELRYRVAAHCRTRQVAKEVCNEVGMVYFDRPAGVAGPRSQIIDAFTVIGVPVERDAVTIETEVVTV